MSLTNGNTTNTRPAYINDFDVPNTLAEARERMLLLATDIASIDDQIEVRRASDDLDPDWLRKALTSRRFKNLEKSRIENWITNMIEAREGYRALNDCIVEIVKSEFSPEEWGELVAEAINNSASGRLGGTV